MDNIKINLENWNLVELNLQEEEDFNGGLLIEVAALCLTVIGGLYYLGSQCAAYDKRHGL